MYALVCNLMVSHGSSIGNMGSTSQPEGNHETLTDHLAGLPFFELRDIELTSGMILQYKKLCIDLTRITDTQKRGNLYILLYMVIQDICYIL